VLCGLGAALVSVVVVWSLMPRTPDAFSAVGHMIQAGPGHASTGPGASVYFGPSSAGGQSPLPTGSPVTSSPAPGSATPSPVHASPKLSGPAKGSSGSPRQSALPGTQAVILNARRGASPAALPTALLGSDVAKAAAHSPTVAVETGASGSFAVAPVNDAGARSAIPLLLAAALIGGLAWLGGAMFSRHRELRPADGPGWPGSQPGPGALPPGTEAIASPELRRLRRDARQRTVLARSLAELVPSMPDALVWQAEKALAEVGVRPVVPDGERFDAAAHHAVGTEPVPPGGREDTIARTIRPGYADDENILVYPKVVVYADDTRRREW
jgi:hypothetical protein